MLFPPFHFSVPLNLKLKSIFCGSSWSFSAHGKQIVIGVYKTGPYFTLVRI